MANKVATKSILEGNTGVRFSFTDGKVLDVLLSDLSEEITTNLILHGIKQKVGDGYSGEGDPASAFALASKVAEKLAAGEWTAAREGGGRISDLAVALSRYTGETIEDCVEVISGMDKKGKQELRKHPDIRPVLAEIALEKAKAAAATSGEGVQDLGALFG